MRNPDTLPATNTTSALNVSPYEISLLKGLIGRRMPHIKYYVCQITKTFTLQGQRMYFTVPYTLMNLKKFLNPSVERMRITTTCGCARTQVRLMEGLGKWATVTTDWTNFVHEAKIKIGDICVFVFEGGEGPLLAIVLNLS